MSKILMIGDLNPAEHDSATTQFLSLAEAFCRHVSRVDIVTRRPRKHSPTSSIKLKNLHLHTWLKRRFRLLQHFRLTFMVLRRRYQLVYLRYRYVPTSLLVLLRWCSRAPVIVHQARWEITATPSRSRFITRRRLKQQLRHARWAHGLHVPTSALATLFTSHGVDDRKLLVIENGSPLNKIYPLAHESSFKRFNLDPDYVYLGFVGTLTERQDLATVLAALALLKEKNSYLKLLIAGEGAQLATLQALTDALNLTDHVFFLGNIPYQDVNALLNTFDVALAPFKNEHTADGALCPLKLRDYAAAGLPTIVAEVPGIRHEHLEQSWLWTYPPADAEALAQVILTLVEQSAARLHMAQAARDYAQHYYDWRKLSKTLLTESLRLARKPHQSLTPQSLLDQ